MANEQAQKAVQEGIRLAIDNDVRKRLGIDPAVKVKVMRVVEGGNAMWTAYLTDRLNERTLVSAPVVEMLKSGVRELLFNPDAIKAFLFAFNQEDPIFFEKTFGSRVEAETETEVEAEDENEAQDALSNKEIQTNMIKAKARARAGAGAGAKAESGASCALSDKKLYQITTHILTLLAEGAIDTAKKELASFVLNLAIETGLEEELAANTAIQQFYEPVVRLRVR